MAAVTQTARFKVVAPIDGDWDRLGAILRTLRVPLHRVANGIVSELELDARRRTHGEILAHPRTISYRLARDLWRAEREFARARLEKGKPLTGDQMVATTVPSAYAILGIAGIAFARWAKYHKEAWRGTMTLPTFRGGGPLYVTSHGVTLTAKDGDTILALRLLAKGHPSTRLIVMPYGGHGYADLSRMLGGAQVGDARLVQDDVDGSWQALISYTHEVAEADGTGTMAVHRGLRTFLTAAVAREGKREAYTTVLETGDDILRHKMGYTARRRSLGQQKRQIGTGAKGHGLTRRHEHITRLEDAEARWVRTKCQEVAAHAIKLALRKGAGRILIEDWSNPARDGAPELGKRMEYMVRSWPFAELRSMIEWAAKRAGIRTEIVRTNANSQTCPGCGHVHAEAQSGTFLCARCMLERPADVVFAWNMLTRDGQPDPLPDALTREKRQRGRRRKSVGAAKPAPREGI